MTLLGQPWFIWSAAFAVSVALPLLWVSRPPRTVALRPDRLNDLRTAVLQRSARERTLGPLAGQLAHLARRATPTGFLKSLETRIARAGRPAAWPVERVLAAKVLLALLGFIGSSMLLVTAPSQGRLLGVIVATLLGYFVPDLLLQQRANERAIAIRQALPDTLDQVSICMQAGLGFESALAQAATGRGALAEELVRTLQEVQMGVSRRDAFQHFAVRTGVADVRHLVMAINQGESYGVPIADILHGQAAEQRIKRRQRAEERAMKMPVKVVFPLILCVLPTLFIVLIGPGAIRIAKSFLGADL